MAKNLNPNLGRNAGLLTIKIETQKFNAFIKNFVRASSLSTSQAIRKIAIDLLNRIMMKNPVLTGRSRAGWYVSMSSLGGPWTDLGNDSASIAKGKKEGKFVNKLNAQLNKYVILINGVYYSIYLEHGTSSQAPAGMVRVSMREMTGKLPKMIEREYKKNWVAGSAIFGRL